MRGPLHHLDDDWYEWRQADLGVELHVRVVPGDGYRLHLGELRIIGEPTSEVLRNIPIGRIEAAANAQLTMTGETADRDRGRDDEPSRGRPDKFYADVATTYSRLAQTSSRPAVELAHRHEVPVTTAHRWIKEARRRGFLATGRPGKAG